MESSKFTPAETDQTGALPGEANSSSSSQSSGCGLSYFELRFEVREEIGSGTFGCVFRGIDKDNDNMEVAIKIEKKKRCKVSSVKNEATFYERLHSGLARENSRGFPKVLFFGTIDKQCILVMEMLGPNLEKLFNLCKRTFSLKTTTQIALQLLDRIEFVHSRGIVHRDIKPENFVIGKPNGDLVQRNKLHVVDFGLSKYYLDHSGVHAPFKRGKELTGTARYASIRTHEGEEQSRRDDIEAIGHMLIYFLRGSLPWQGLKVINKGVDSKTMNKLRYKKIEQKKKSISVQELCSGLPDQFRVYLNYARSVVAYEDKPDYRFLKDLFLELQQTHNYPDDQIYDWDEPGVAERPEEEGNQSVSNIKVQGSEVLVRKRKWKEIK